MDQPSGTGTLLAPGLIGVYTPVVAGDSGKELELMISGHNSALEFHTACRHNCACAATGSIAPLLEHGLVTLVGNPRWKSAQYQQIASAKNHAEALSTAYIQHGISCLDYIEGAFSCIILDPVHSQCYAVTDKLGIYPIYYSEIDQGIVFGSSASSILNHSRVDRKLRQEGIYDYVYFHMVPSPVSIYQQISKLPAAHFIRFSIGSVSLTNYWIPNFDEHNEADLATLYKQLRDVLRSSVDHAVSDYSCTGTFLSGGLDSSTVTGFFAALNSGSSKAYSIGFSAEGYDEMAYARITARHFGVDLHEYYVTPEDVVAALPIIATSYDEPFGNSSALPAYFCAKLAREDGVARLLAGDGGDELFAGNERYAKQAVFEYYTALPRIVRKFLLEPATSILPNSVTIFRKAQSYIRQANTPLPDRLQTYNFLHQHQADEIFTAEFLSAVKVTAPLELQRETYLRPHDASTLNRMLYFDWQYTLADNDIRKVSHMCSLAGIEVTYPMLDEQLLNFSLNVPSQLKLKGNDLRYFYKNALTNWLPDETIGKKKQGFGLPFGVWMQTHVPLQEMAYDNLLKLKETGYFNSSFLDKAIDLHRTGHAAYYGELIWILMVLQLWMDKHA